MTVSSLEEFPALLEKIGSRHNNDVYYLRGVEEEMVHMEGGTSTRAHMGCWVCRWRFYPLYHTTDLRDFFFEDLFYIFEKQSYYRVS